MLLVFFLLRQSNVNIMKYFKKVRIFILNLIAGIFFIIMKINFLEGKTIEITAMKDILKNIDFILERYDKEDILLAFDIDLTLTVPDEPAVQIPYLNKYHVLLQKIMSGLNNDQGFLLFSIATKKPPQILIDVKTPSIIKKLQKKGIKIIALSSSITGELGSIKRVEEWRYDALKKFGVVFDLSFPQITDLILTDIVSYRDQHPVFYQGILCTNSQKKIKGKTLMVFLKKINYSPKIIILVDDQKDNLNEMYEAIKQSNSDIEFLGIEYKVGKQFTSANISEQEFIAYWLNIVKSNHELISLQRKTCK